RVWEDGGETQPPVGRMGFRRHWCRRCGRKHCRVGVGGNLERPSPPIAGPEAGGVRLFVVAVRRLRRSRRTLTPRGDGPEGWWLTWRAGRPALPKAVLRGAATLALYGAQGASR